MNSEISTEITLQPLRRYKLDAAIIFSDILIVPSILGQKVDFGGNKGPVLSTLNIDRFKKNNENIFKAKLLPVYKSIKLTRKKLNNTKSLISFIGAPWTLLVYMFGLKTDKNTIDQKKLSLKENDIKEIIPKLISYLCIHIEEQRNAGSDVVQIFDSWAGLIPNDKINELCYKPNKKIVDFCKEKKIPVICFPKGIKENYKTFTDIVRPNGISIDYDVNPNWAKENLKDVCIQGGLDPKILFEEENYLMSKVENYLSTFSDRPYIFNLGHGLLPETNPDILIKIIDKVNKFK